MKRSFLVFCGWLGVLMCLASGMAAAKPALDYKASPSPLTISIQALLGNNPKPAAAPAAPPAAGSPAATPAPASEGETPAANANSDENAEPQETIGTRTLSDLLVALDTLKTQAQSFLAEFSAPADIAAWLDRQSTNPRYAEHWSAIGYDLIYIVGVSFVAAALLEMLLYPARQNLRRRKPSLFAGRIAVGLTIQLLRFLSVLLFISISLTLLDKTQDPHVVRFVVLNIVYALAICRLVVMFSRLLFAPRNAPLRIVPATAVQASYAHRWVCAFSVVIAFGYFFIDAAYAVHFPATGISIFNNLLGFILVAMTITVITQKRVYVSARLRGNLPSSHKHLSLWQSMRLWFARRWHILAMMYLVLGYLITALGVQDGFALMLRGTILTLLILLLMRALFHAVNHWGASDASDGFHHAALRFMFRLVIWAGAIVAAAAGWGADIPTLFATPVGQRIMNAGFSIGVTIVTVTLVYEIFSALIDRHLTRRDETGEAFKASARARTLLPMIRNTAFIIFTLIVGLVVLSAAGVNIAPLLAGAGVVGVAIGFGSQTLVRDFITGLFIVLENIVAVGDFVKIGDFTGIVETISVRTIRLRDENGALHVLPFSEVSKITNMTRDFSYALIDVGVACDSDLDRVMDVIRSVGRDIERDAETGRLILEPVEVLGVETLGDFSITIRSRVRTLPGMQREVRRIFLLRLKQRFDKEGIEIPFPTVTYIRQRLEEPEAAKAKA